MDSLLAAHTLVSEDSGCDGEEVEVQQLRRPARSSRRHVKFAVVAAAALLLAGALLPSQGAAKTTNSISATPGLRAAVQLEEAVPGNPVVEELIARAQRLKQEQQLQQEQQQQQPQQKEEEQQLLTPKEREQQQQQPQQQQPPQQPQQQPQQAQQPQQPQDAVGTGVPSAEAAGGAVAGALVPSTSLPPIARAENLHDGNVCDDNEEFYGGLCYKKCSILTSGMSPVRTSSWTCCGDPCTTENGRGNLGFEVVCDGFDINGEDACPHAPGVCYANEEWHVGICYKKCSLLTNGKYPHRMGGATCCRVGGLGCLDVMNDKTRAEYDVGGGVGDHDPSTEDSPHPPEEQLSEAEGVPQSASDLPLAPKEHLHDGNVCDDQEELYGGLCYKKCSLFTNGEAPIRTSSWTCCESHPCGVANDHGSIGYSMMCDGFDQSAAGTCPHPPGACLTDEEFSLGTCYKKCSILTNGLFKYRYTGVTCCKVEGWGCLNPYNLRTDGLFDVGGGAGDGNPATNALPHPPQQSLTEE